MPEKVLVMKCRLIVLLVTLLGPKLDIRIPNKIIFNFNSSRSRCKVNSDDDR